MSDTVCLTVFPSICLFASLSVLQVVCLFPHYDAVHFLDVIKVSHLPFLRVDIAGSGALRAVLLDSQNMKVDDVSEGDRLQHFGFWGHRSVRCQD